MTLLLAEGAAAGESSGVYLISFLVSALVLTWPIYRRILRWLGALFLVFGIVLSAAALGGTPLDPHAAGLAAGGLALRLVGGFRPLRTLKRVGVRAACNAAIAPSLRAPGQQGIHADAGACSCAPAQGTSNPALGDILEHEVSA